MARPGRPRPVRTLQRVASWDALIELMRGNPRRFILLADVEPAVSGWNSAPEDLVHALRATTSTLQRRLPTLDAVVWLSNARLRLASDACRELAVISKARKPVTPGIRTVIGERSLDDVVVVGDQWVTDGLLAARLGCGFVLWDSPETVKPWWPKLQTRMAFGLFRTIVLRRTTSL